MLEKDSILGSKMEAAGLPNGPRLCGVVGCGKCLPLGSNIPLRFSCKNGLAKEVQIAWRYYFICNKL
jgi:hypothetical protein